jgi:putative DNA primase/helicase
LPTNVRIPNEQTRDNTSSPRRRRRRRPRHDLEVRFDDQRRDVRRSDLSNEDYYSELVGVCCEASSVSFHVHSDLLTWNDEERSRFLNAVHSTNGTVTIGAEQERREFDNLLEFVLSVVEDDSNASRFENSRRLALEAAVLTHPDALESACRQIRRHFHELGVRSLTLASLRNAALAIEGEDQELADPTVAAECFHDALRQPFDLPEDEFALRYYRDTFYLWNGRCWEPQGDRLARARVIRWLQSQDNAPKITDKFVTDMLSNLRGLTLADAWDRELPLWIDPPNPPEDSAHRVFQNGMVDMGGVSENDRPDLYEFDTRNFDQIALPFNYDPNATCPLWRETLTQIFPRTQENDHRIEVLQEFLGWSMSPQRIKLDKFLIMEGAGANGKSTILEVWVAVLGENNVSHVPLSEFGGEFRLHAMAGKLANIASDMTRVEKIEEGLLKELTSGDKVQVNRKHKDPISMVPTARLIFATNALPPINDKSDGVWRRMIAMPFFVQFSEAEQDRERASRLAEEELPGIFNWALEGLRRLVRNDGFTECDVCRESVSEHRMHSDPFAQFVDERCTRGVHLREPTAALYSAYRSFCKTAGRMAVNSSEFGKRVASLEDVSRERETSGDRQYEYVGIALLQGGLLVGPDRTS